jgi:hypothetical protein
LKNPRKCNRVKKECSKILSVPDTRVGHCLGPEGNGVSSREGGEGGQTPQTRREISSQPQRGRRQHGEGRRRKDESGVMNRNQRAQSEHLQESFLAM